MSASSSITYLPIGTLTLGTTATTIDGVGLAFAGQNAEVARGSLGGVYAAPYLSDNSGTPFGNTLNGQDSQAFLTTGTGNITMSMPGEEQYFGLLWGSVDSSNTLSFYNGSTLIDTVTGSQIMSGANGSQGAAGSVYVNINSSSPFNRVVAGSGNSPSFEFTNIAFGSSEMGSTGASVGSGAIISATSSSAGTLSTSGSPSSSPTSASSSSGTSTTTASGSTTTASTSSPSSSAPAVSTASGITFADIGSLTPGTGSVSINGINLSFSGAGQIAKGNAGGVYAAPYLSNGDGAPFGESANGQDTQSFLSTGAGSVTMTLPGQEHYFGLLWGSVDSSNTLSLYQGSTLVETIKGSQITANASGDQGVNGSFYVNVNSAAAFDKVVASNNAPSFEFSNIAYSTGETAASGVSIGSVPAATAALSDPSSASPGTAGATSTTSSTATGGTMPSAASSGGPASPGGTAITSTVPVALTGPTAGAGADTLTITVSQDYYKGPAQFNVAMNGTVIGTKEVVDPSVIHSSGGTETFTFRGGFQNANGSSPTVGISFINDLYGGSPSKDRNLYVTGVSLDGKSPSSQTASLYSNGTASFSMPASPAASSSGSSSSTSSGSNGSSSTTPTTAPGSTTGTTSGGSTGQTTSPPVPVPGSGGTTATGSSSTASGSSGTATSQTSVPTTLPAPSATILTVGANGEYQTLAAAAQNAVSGDTIYVQAGTYTNDFATINGGTGAGVTVQAVGGMVNEVATVPPPNEKALIDVSGNVTINGLSFSDVAISANEGGNGAGIRYENGNLTLNNDIFTNNQDGVLGNDDSSGSITVNNSIFANNGSGTGYTHDIYANHINSLTVSNSFFSGDNAGHEIKSRAANTTVTNSTIQDGPTGQSSYLIDTPNGGNVTISGNVIDKGPNAENPILVTSGEEGVGYSSNSLNVSGNTFVNNLQSYNTGVRNDTPATATISNNGVFGLSSSQISSGPATVSGTTMLGNDPTLNVPISVSNAVMSFMGGSGTAAPTPASTGLSAAAFAMVSDYAGMLNQQVTAGSLSSVNETKLLDAGYMGIAGGYGTSVNQSQVAAMIAH